MAARDRELGLSVPVTEVLNPAMWRQRYAHGVLLGAVTRVREDAGKTGDPRPRLKQVVDAIPDEVIRWHLRVALSELEMKLGVRFGVLVCRGTPVDDTSARWRDYDREVARLPYSASEAERWFRIDLPSGVISVDRVRAYYYGTKVWEISEVNENTELLRVQWARQGIMHILPTNMQSIMVSQGGNYGVWHTIFQHRSPIPDFWSVDYTVGPVADNGRVGHIEAVLAHWCYCAAGILLLNMAGMAVSKGLTSTSVSMDGVSRSVSLQASAMYGMNSALEHVFDEAMKRIDWKAMRAAKKGLRLKMFGG